MNEIDLIPIDIDSEQKCADHYQAQIDKYAKKRLWYTRKINSLKKSRDCALERIKEAEEKQRIKNKFQN